MKPMMVCMRVVALLLTFGGCSAGLDADTGDQGGDPYTALEAQWQRKGVQVEPAAEVVQPFFTVKGRVVRLDGKEVQLFVFPSNAEASKDATKIFTQGAQTVHDLKLQYGIPHFYRKGRVIVLYIGEDERTMQILDGALGRQFLGGSGPEGMGGCYICN
ncbi:MAG: hypothetical protein EXR62_08275 [Chloroflexi bacterium]|nr:hypothetical protein [Chloroflexota bacterium]